MSESSAEAPTQPARGPSWRARLYAGLEQHPRLRREILFLGGSLLAGAVVVPVLIYIVGQATLGDYASGGFWSLLADFYSGVLRGWPPALAVALGPYALVLVLRTARYVMKRFLTADRAHSTAHSGREVHRG